MAHCHFWFRRFAIEALVDAADWSAVEHHAKALESYARPQPLRWTEFWVGWARAFAAHNHTNRDAQVEADLVRLRAEAERTGMSSVLPRLDRMLNAD